MQAQAKGAARAIPSGTPRRGGFRDYDPPRFRGGFLIAPSPLLLPKKARLVRLFACERAHNGSLSLPPFRGPISGNVKHLYCQ